jgi:hypothetical protein
MSKHNTSPIQTSIKQSVEPCCRPFRGASQKQIQIHIVEKLANTIARAKLPVLGLLMAALLTGCAQTRVSRTVGLTGLAPVAVVDQIKVFKVGEAIIPPYQVVGKIAIDWHQGFFAYSRGLSSKYSDRRMKEVAAGMGADGVIGVRATSFNCRGLAVKWLAPGEDRRPVTTPFIVTVLPIKDAQDTPGHEASRAIARAAAYAYGPLEQKGYYVLPHQGRPYTGGLEKASKLSPAELKLLFGPDTHLLLEITRCTKADSFVIQATAGIKSTLMNTATRTNVFEGTGAGRGGVGGGGQLGLIPLLALNAMEPDAKRFNAVVGGISKSLESLKPIQERLPK